MNKPETSHQIKNVTKKRKKEKCYWSRVERIKIWIWTVAKANRKGWKKFRQSSVLFGRLLKKDWLGTNHNFGTLKSISSIIIRITLPLKTQKTSISFSWLKKKVKLRAETLLPPKFSEEKPSSTSSKISKTIIIDSKSIQYYEWHAIPCDSYKKPSCAIFIFYCIKTCFFPLIQKEIQFFKGANAFNIQPYLIRKIKNI